MDHPNQKWVNLSYLAVAGLMSYIFFAAVMKLTGVYDIEAKVKNFEILLRLSSIVVGGVLFFALYRNAKSNEFMNEVVSELSKVTWPTQKETSSATVITIVMVLVSGLVLGFLDYVWTKVMQWIL